MWARHDVRERSAGSKRFSNPFVGPLTLKYQSFKINGTEGQTLFVYFAEPGTPHEQSLTLLAGIAAGQACPSADPAPRRYAAPTQED
jgi:hypothetical protein